MASAAVEAVAFDAADEALHVFAQDDIDKVEEEVCVTVYGKELALSLLLKEDELAPLFSGAAWAGTLLWDAAIYLTRRFLTKYRNELERPNNTLRVIELGAGIGVPGMAARVAGAHHVVITEQDDLLELMHRNLADNADILRISDQFSSSDSSETNGAIHARPLSWGVAETAEYFATYGDDQGYDVILSCDCIYEPLYGQSWKALAQTMELLCLKNPRALVMMGVERRNQDGIDKFLTFVDETTQLKCEMVEQTIGSTQNTLQLYYLQLRSASSETTTQ